MVPKIKPQKLPKLKNQGVIHIKKDEKRTASKESVKKTIEPVLA